MNPAPAHLEAKFRIWEFTVGQLAAVFCGVLLGMVWAKFLCPADGLVAAVSGVYIAALPAMPVFFASQTDFDLWLIIRGAAGWRRHEGRFLPGPGGRCHGYLTDGHDRADAPGPASELALETLWEPR